MKTKLLWLSIPVAAAAGTGLYLLKKKKASSGAPAPAKKAGGKTAEKAIPAVDPASLKEGVYSFISGFQNAATVEVKFRYDGNRFLCTIMEDGFLADSGDSHVAVLSGEDFSAQLEYGTYYAGEDFAKLKVELAAKRAVVSLHDTVSDQALTDAVNAIGKYKVVSVE